MLAMLAPGSAVNSLPAADRPNILWLTCEDNSVDWVGCYGNPYAETPNIDAYLAASALALENNPANLEKLYKGLKGADSGVRYRAIEGLFNIQESAGLDMGIIRENPRPSVQIRVKGNYPRMNADLRS